MDILNGGFWVEVRFKDYSTRSTYMHIYFEFWLWGAFNMFNITVTHVALVDGNQEKYLMGKITRVGFSSPLSTTDESVFADRRN